jgi:hypothetical protein
LARSRRARAGVGRMRVAGRNRHGFSLRDFGIAKHEGRSPVPHWMNDYAAFFAALVAGCAVFLAFSFAVNSCFTLAVIASVSTL